MCFIIGHAYYLAYLIHDLRNQKNLQGIVSHHFPNDVLTMKAWCRTFQIDEHRLAQRLLAWDFEAGEIRDFLKSQSQPLVVLLVWPTPEMSRACVL